MRYKLRTTDGGFGWSTVPDMPDIINLDGFIDSGICYKLEKGRFKGNTLISFTSPVYDIYVREVSETGRELLLVPENFPLENICISAVEKLGLKDCACFQADLEKGLELIGAYICPVCFQKTRVKITEHPKE